MSKFVELLETSGQSAVFEKIGRELSLRALVKLEEATYSTKPFNMEPESAMHFVDGTSPEKVEQKLGLKPGSLKTQSSGYSNSFIINGDDGSSHSIYSRLGQIRIRPLMKTDTHAGHTQALLKHLQEDRESKTNYVVTESK